MSEYSGNEKEKASSLNSLNLKSKDLRSAGIMRLRPHRACSLPLVGLVLVFALYGCDPCAMAQEPSSNDATAAIKATAEAFSKVFADKDADALAEMWTSDGEYIDENGNRFAGRDAIKQEYKNFFEAHPDIKMTVNTYSIRLLSPTTAIEEGITSVEPLPTSPLRSMTRVT